ncbi:hypothetical protein ACJX0J_009307, partial [Zea mays]
LLYDPFLNMPVKYGKKSNKLYRIDRVYSKLVFDNIYMIYIYSFLCIIQFSCLVILYCTFGSHVGTSSLSNVNENIEHITHRDLRKVLNSVIFDMIAIQIIYRICQRMKETIADDAPPTWQQITKQQIWAIWRASTQSISIQNTIMLQKLNNYSLQELITMTEHVKKKIVTFKPGKFPEIQTELGKTFDGHSLFIIII